MLRYFLFSCLCSMLTVGLFAQNVSDNKLLFASYKNGKWGAHNNESNVVIPHLYDRLFIDSNNFAHACKDSLHALIDRNGKIILPAAYDHIVVTDSYKIIARKGKLMIIFDIDGNKILEEEELEAEEANEHYFILTKRNKQFLYNTRDQKETKGYKKINCIDPDDNVFILKKARKECLYFPERNYQTDFYVHISKKNKQLYFLYDDFKKYILTIADSFTIQETEDFFYIDLTDSSYAYLNKGKLHIRDMNGGRNFQFEADSIGDFFSLKPKNGFNNTTLEDFIIDTGPDQYAYISKDSLCGIINGRYELIAPIEYNDISAYGFNFFKIQKNGKTGLLSKDGKIIIPPLYDHIQKYNDLFYVTGEKGKGLYDDKEQLLQAKYESIRYSENDWFIFMKDKKYGIVKTGDNILCDAEYGSIRKTRNAFIVGKLIDDKMAYGVLQKNGRFSIPIQYDHIETLYSELLKIGIKDGKQMKYGIVTEKGKKLIKPSFGDIYATDNENIFKTRSFSHQNLSVKKINDIKNTDIRVPYDDRPRKRYLTGYVNIFGEVLLDTLYWEPQIKADFRNQMFEVRYDTVFMIVTYENNGRFYDKTIYNNYISVNEYNPVRTFVWKGRRINNDPIKYGLYYGNIRVLSHDYDRYAVTSDDDFNSVYVFRNNRPRMGMVDMRRGRLLLKPVYRIFSFKSVRSSNLTGLENVYGRYVIVDRNFKIIKKGLGYVGSFHKGFTRINIGGKKTVVETGSDDYRKHLPYSLKERIPFRTDYDFVQGGKWGIIDSMLNTLVDPRYGFIHEYHCGGYLAEKKGKWGKISPYNEILIEFIYDRIECFKKVYPKDIDSSELRIIQYLPFYKAKKGGSWGVIDTAGNIIVPFEFNKIELEADTCFTAFITVKKNRKNLYGYIDEKGRQKCLPKFIKAEAFKNGFARVQIKPKEWRYIDTAMNILPCGPFREALSFSDGLACVKEKYTWGYIDESGQSVIPPQFRKAAGFSDGLAPVYTKTEYTHKGKTRKTNAWIYINKHNKQAIKDRYTKAFEFYKGTAIAYKNGKYGLINTSGKKRTAFHYTYITRFNGYDLYKARKGNEKYSIMNGEGKKLIPFRKYDRIGEFHDGLCPVMYRRKSFFIDRDGNKKISVNAENLGNFKYGKALIVKKRKFEFIDTDGNTIIETKYVNSGYNYYKSGDQIILNPEHQISDSLYYLIREKNQFARKNLELVNTHSEPVLISYVQDIKDFSEGFAAFGIKTTFGIFDTRGNQIAENGYVHIEKVAPGLFKLTTLNEIRYIKIRQ